MSITRELTVFYASLYSHRLNTWRRFVGTADGHTDMERQALDCVGEGWRCEHTDRICDTTSEPFIKEL